MKMVKISHAFGYEQAEKFVNEARSRGEQIEFVETTFLEEHSKLVELIRSIKIAGVFLHKENDEKAK